MTERLDHETCSELLRPFLEGRLETAAARSVSEHLGSCDRCRGEARALKALAEPGDPLTGAESEALRQAVWSATRRQEVPVLRPASVAPARQWKGLRILGAAALLIAGVVFVRTMPFGGEGDGTAGLGGATDSDQVAEISNELSFRRPPANRTLGGIVPAAPDAAPEQESQALDASTEKRAESAKAAGSAAEGGTGGGGGSAGAGSTEFKGAAGPPRPLYVRGAGNLSEQRLRLVGRYGLPLVFFPRSYTVEDAASLQDDYLVQLANAAETEERSQQVIDCGAQVIGESTDALPALATYGSYQGEPVFLLALGWSESGTGRLDRFMVWTWPEGDCSGVPSYRAGRIGV